MNGASQGPDSAPQRLVLGIESSGNTGSVALLGPRGMLGCLTFTSPSLYSQRLMPSVDWLAGRAGVSARDITGVAVARGPGSFTGLRIGMSVAKAIAYAADASIVGVPTLEAMALGALAGCPPGMPVCVLLDARQGQVYAGLYAAGAAPAPERGAGGTLQMPSAVPEALRADFAGPLEEVCGWITGPTLFAGEGALRLEAALRDALGDRFVLAPAARLLPSATEVAVLGALRLERGGADDPALLVPEYLRRSYTEKRKPA